VAALAEAPERYESDEVIVSGLLKNAGTGYFSDLRLVLEDPDGRQVRVKPWIPLEVPPPRPGGGGERPRVLSDYLDRVVVLRGRVVREEEDGERIYLLEVHSATPVPSYPDR
jgi:hypothetical protein